MRKFFARIRAAWRALWGTPGVLEARALVLRDDDGRRRVVLNGGGADGKAFLAFLNQDGAECVRLEVPRTGQEVMFRIWGANGRDVTMHTAPYGQPCIVLGGKIGGGGMVLTLRPDDTPSIEFRDGQGRMHTGVLDADGRVKFEHLSS